MYTVKGAYAEALITIDDLDPEALTQLYGLLNAKAAEGSHVAIMPDGHPGKDCLVGFTQRFGEDAEVRLVPNFVGGDIACGVFAWPIMEFLGVDEKGEAIKTNHNYYVRMERTIRKGAVSAKKGELHLCPINMRDGTFICRGKGNGDWNESAPHGAGRLMSRSEAKELFDIESVRATLGNLFTTTVDSSLDEAPDAYKSFDFIRRHITPTADIVDRLVPVYNFKG